MKIKIATRASPLALWQAEHVKDRLMAAHSGLDCELVPMRTQGDKMLDSPLAKIGGKGLFVKELERAMLEREADIAVHSMKDVPVELPPGLAIVTVLSRGNPRDALVSNDYPNLAALAPGARVGSSSLRRQSQLRILRPDLKVESVRGNVQTRLAKLDSGEFDALLLAASGLERLGLEGRIREQFDPATMLPAIGQGTLGVEARADDQTVCELLRPLHDTEANDCLMAERALNARLGGGCQVPFAAFAQLRNEEVWLRGLIASDDGATVLRAEGSATPANAEALGEHIAERLLDEGAGQIIETAYQAH